MKRAFIISILLFPLLGLGQDSIRYEVAKPDCDCQDEGNVSSQSIISGAANWGTAIANITSMMNASSCDEKMLQVAEKLRLKNNDRTLKQLINIRKKYENDEITFFEMMNRKAAALKMTVKELAAHEAEIHRLSSLSLYQKKN